MVYEKQNLLMLKIVKHLLYIEFELKRKLKKVRNRLFFGYKKGGF